MILGRYAPQDDGKNKHMMKLMEWIRRVSSTKYTRTLEADVARLRADNRALLNSILGIAGVPPIPARAADADKMLAGEMAAQDGGGNEISATAGIAPDIRGIARGGCAQAAAPLRRRSWQQI